MAKDKNENLIDADLPFIDSAFAIDENDLPENQRIAVRYIRDDISLTLQKDGLFKWGNTPEVKLIDISSKGVHVSSDIEIKVKKKFILVFEFKDGKKFQTEGTVVYNHPEKSLRYGIKFKKFEHELSDYLVETQKELNLKK